MGEFLHPVTWLIVFGALIAVEAVTMGLTTIWFAGGAIVTFIVAMFTDNWVIESICFLAVSTILLIFTRPLALKVVNTRRLKTNVDSLPGQIGKVVEKIDRFNGTGSVLLNGLEWSARATADGQVFEPDTKVRVSSVSGVTLLVEEEKEE